MSPFVRYLIRLELGLTALALILGVTYYFAHGPLPAVRIFFGSLVVANLGLLWVFRKSLVDYFRGRRN
ncbi:MAG: hypothetical protein LKCHEGNO_03214 [Burkholderiaceae bacterium]|nr:hypothetical protein [Burkholderiaceae bacterium]